MSAEARALLDQLMGAERDVRLEERTNKSKQFDEPDVCKYHLCGVCPYELFRNTRSDLGACSRTSVPECKEQWEALSQEEKDRYGYEYDLMVLLEELVQGLDRKIRDLKARMEAAERESERIYGKNEDREEEKKVILAKIEELNAQAEAAGDEGDVEKAMALMEQTKELNAQMDAVDEEIKKAARREGNEKKLRVCEVCGIKIEINPINNEERCGIPLRSFPWRPSHGPRPAGSRLTTVASSTEAGSRSGSGSRSSRRCVAARGRRGPRAADSVTSAEIATGETTATAATGA